MIRIYSIPDCPYCSEIKELLCNDNIPFIDINVMLPEHEEEYNKLVKITNSNDVPVVKVGKQLLVPNVSFHSIKECFDTTKKLLTE